MPKDSFLHRFSENSPRINQLISGWFIRCIMYEVNRCFHLDDYVLKHTYCSCLHRPDSKVLRLFLILRPLITFVSDCNLNCIWTKPYNTYFILTPLQFFRHRYFSFLATLQKLKIILMSSNKIRRVDFSAPAYCRRSAQVQLVHLNINIVNLTDEL